VRHQHGRDGAPCCHIDDLQALQPRMGGEVDHADQVAVGNQAGMTVKRGHGLGKQGGCLAAERCGKHTRRGKRARCSSHDAEKAAPVEIHAMRIPKSL
jgi:hypothetical protein